MASFFKLWKKSAASRPYITIATTEFVLASTGDALAQTMVHYEIFSSEKKNTHNPGDSWYSLERTIRFAFCAASLSPISFRWHKFLDKRFPLLNLKPNVSKLSQMKPVAKRVASDQLIFEPFLYIALFTQLGVFENRDASEIKHKLVSVAFPAYLTGLTLFPFIQAFNFAFVPLVLRVPFSSTFDIFWDTYLSWCNGNDQGIPKPSVSSQSVIDISLRQTSALSN
jgi:protein Mpv17